MTQTAIAAVAVIGVPGKMGEDAVPGFITLREQGSANETEITDNCRPGYEK
jgi:hypothetical protein